VRPGMIVQRAGLLGHCHPLLLDRLHLLRCRPSYSNTRGNLFRARKRKDSPGMAGCWKGGRKIDLPIIVLQPKKKSGTERLRL
jgi:hypothetical protein